MRPPGPIGASPRPPARPPPAARRQPPGSRSRRRHSRSLCAAAAATASPAAIATGWVRSPEVKPLRPPPLAAAPPPLSPGLAHPSPCRSAHLLRHPRLPGSSFPGLSPRFQAVAPRHSGAWPLRTCVRLTAPFSTLAAPFPVSLCPSGSVEDKRSGSPGTVRFYPGTSLDVRGEMSSLTLSQHPQTSSRPPRPLLPCTALSSPVTAPLSAARGRGLEQRVCPGPEGGPAQLCPSPRSPLLLPAPGNPGDGGPSPRTRLHLLGRGGTHVWREIGTSERGLGC